MSGVTRGRWGAPLRAPRPADAADEATPLPRALQAARPCFAEIYGQHFDFVWRSLRHLGVAPPALDDAVQEVWLVVHRQLPQFEGRSKVTTWLFGVALNVARNQCRKARPSSGAEAAVDEMPSRAPDPEKLLVAQDAWLEVQRFLDMLDDVPRAIFVSALLENLSPAETADAMGLDVGLVYRRVRALRRAFARRLGRNEEGSQ